MKLWLEIAAGTSLTMLGALGLLYSLYWTFGCGYTIALILIPIDIATVVTALVRLADLGQKQ
jgi:hypothetical protein